MQRSANSPGALAASFISPNELKPGLTLVTGPRGAGKTRWCMDLVEHARSSGLNPRGLASPSVMEGGQKVGIDLLDLGNGERRRLAYRKGDAGGDLWTSDWQIVAETLNLGNAILERIKSCDLFILDEAGPLEFEHGIGLVAGLDIVDARKNFPCFVVVRPSLLSVVRQRWSWADVLDVNAEAEA